MPKNKDFKRLVRERQTKTGESYTTARAQVLTRPTERRREPVTCAITGAAGRVAYNLLFQIASGGVLGADTPVALRLIDIEDALPALEGTVMELEDGAFPLLSSVDVCSSYEAGFDNASLALLLGAPRRTAGMERGDLLAQTAASFSVQGAAIQATAAADVRVIVVGNPANTNCLCARSAAPDVGDERWFAMMRLDHNRARSQLADHLGVSLASVTRTSVWGNHSPTMVPDAWHALVNGEAAVDALSKRWVEDEFIPSVQHRGAQLIEVAGASSAFSAAAALTDTVHDLFVGTEPGDWTSLGVVSHGEYHVPDGLVFGYPVAMDQGRVEVQEGLNIGATQRAMLDRTIDELEQERDAALRAIRPT